MKVIDLVKQIALKNIPKRIKYNDFEWEYDGENYKIQASSDTYMNWDYIIFNCLNEEVEIIEEDKKIEKLWFSLYEMERVNKEVLEKIENKINEIIDYLEEKDNE